MSELREAGRTGDALLLLRRHPGVLARRAVSDMAGRPAGCGRRSNSTAVLVGALAAAALCASVLGAAEDSDATAADTEAAAKAAGSCETGDAGSSLPLTGWVVLQWTLVMALARCVSLRQARALERVGPLSLSLSLSLSLYLSIMHLSTYLCLSLRDFLTLRLHYAVG